MRSFSGGFDDRVSAMTEYILSNEDNLLDSVKNYDFRRVYYLFFKGDDNTTDVVTAALTECICNVWPGVSYIDALEAIIRRLPTIPSYFFTDRCENYLFGESYDLEISSKFEGTEQHINKNAFTGLSKIHTLTLSPSVNSFGVGAFNNCSMDEVVLHQQIVPNVFTNCNAIKKVKIEVSPFTFTSDIFGYVPDSIFGHGKLRIKESELKMFSNKYKDLGRN